MTRRFGAAALSDGDLVNFTNIAQINHNTWLPHHRFRAPLNVGGHSGWHRTGTLCYVHPDPNSSADDAPSRAAAIGRAAAHFVARDRHRLADRCARPIEFMREEFRYTCEASRQTCHAAGAVATMRVCD